MSETNKPVLDATIAKVMALLAEPSAKSEVDGVELVDGEILAIIDGVEVAIKVELI